MECPAWIGRAAATAMITLPEKKWTADGNTAHAVLSGDLDESEVDDDDLDSAIRTCRIHEEKMLISIGFEDFETHSEKRIFLRDHAGAEVASGQPDRVHIAGKQFAIIDYKTGRKDVHSPVMNPQLIAYAVLAAQEYGAEEGYLGISYAWRQTPPMAFIEKDTLASWKESILVALEISKEADAPAKAGAHCEYCPVRWSCPDAWDVVKQAKDTLTIDMTVDQFAEHYDLAKQAEGTIKAFMEQMKARLNEDPHSIPGLGLGKASETKAIPGSESAYSRMTSLYDPSKVLAAAKWTPAALAKSLSPGKGQKQAQKDIEQELADIIAITPRAPSIERTAA